jgi:uncharacterized protein DUF664
MNPPGFTDVTYASDMRGKPVGHVEVWEGRRTSRTPGGPLGKEQLYALWDDAVERSRGRLSAALADGGPGQLVHASRSDGVHASLRRLVGDLIEEYGPHTGHADILREAVDGRTGF